jgi:hypothetical protein
MCRMGSKTRTVGNLVTHASFRGSILMVRNKLRTLRSYNELRTLRSSHMMSGQDDLIFSAMTVLNVV